MDPDGECDDDDGSVVDGSRRGMIFAWPGTTTTTTMMVVDCSRLRMIVVRPVDGNNDDDDENARCAPPCDGDENCNLLPGFGTNVSGENWVLGTTLALFDALWSDLNFDRPTNRHLDLFRTVI